jgi:hypothetical protein
MQRNPDFMQRFIKRQWQPAPITPPTVDPDLEHLNGVQRSAEVLRYSILSIEWWISPNGRLREWLRLNGKGSAILLIPALLILPLVGFILWQLLWWALMLVSLAGKLIVLPIAALIDVAVSKGAILLLKTILR